MTSARAESCIFPTTGVVMLKRLRALDVVEIAQRETNYHQHLGGNKKDR